MRDISASVQFIGGTTELMMTPRIAAGSRPAIVKRLRVRTPYSSTVWTRAVVRRQFAISSSSRKTPRTVFVLPTSTVSSIRSLPPEFRSLFAFATLFLGSGHDRAIQSYVACNYCHRLSASFWSNAQESFWTQPVGHAREAVGPIRDAHTLAAREARHGFEVANDTLRPVSDELIVVGLEFAQQPDHQFQPRLRPARFDAQGCGDRAEFGRELLLIHVDADAHDDEANLVRFGMHLREDAAEFFAADQNVVRPFQIGFDIVLGPNRRERRQTRHHRQQRSLHGRDIRAEQDRDVDPGRSLGMP